MLSKDVKHPVIRIVILLTIIICAIESVMKGWSSFFLAPVSLIVLPLYASVMYASLKQDSGHYIRHIRLISALLTISMLAAYICMIGVDDSTEAVVFGFVKSPIDSQLSDMSTLIATMGLIFVPITLLSLVFLLIANKPKAKK